MRGLERTLIIAVITTIAILILVLIWLGVPMGFGKWGSQEITFCKACYFWSLTYFRGSIAENPNTGERFDMSALCAKKLGIVAMPIDSSEGVPEWDRCRESCKFGC